MCRLTPPIILYTLIILTHHYATPITINLASTPSVTDYFQDFANCPCDVTPSLCDNYCCCDSSCSQNSVSSWSNNLQCLAQSKTIEKMCSMSSGRGFGAFDNLACVYYTNRGIIGNYYSSTQSTSSNAPSSNLFSSVVAQSAETTVSSTIDALQLGSKYTSSNQYIKVTGTRKYLFAPLPGIGPNCAPSTLNISASGTYTCRMTPTAQNCDKINAAYNGTYSICGKGDCNSFVSSMTVLNSQLSGTTACLRVISSLTMNVVLKYANGQYQIDSSSTSVFLTTPSVPLNTPYNVVVTITTNISQTRSGNPGYIIGKSIGMPNSIKNIIASTGSNCQAASSVSSTAIDVAFGVQKTVRCLSPSPCTTNSYYIDTLGSASVSFNKYGSQSSESVVMGGTGSGVGNCNKQSYEVNILYSYSGWELDPQYYISAAYLTTKDSSDEIPPTQKYLTFKWLYVDPSSITTPPTNNFYLYFNKLWTPLKQKFGLD